MVVASRSATWLAALGFAIAVGATATARAHGASIGFVVAGEGTPTQAVKIGEVLGAPTYVGLVRVGLGGWTASGMRVEAGWRGGTSSRSQDIGGFGSRTDEDLRGFWLRAGWRVPLASPLSVQMGAEWGYLECESVLHSGQSDPAATSVERSLGLPTSLVAELGSRLSIEFWVAPEWIWGSGTDEYTGYSQRWDLLGFAGGVGITAAIAR
jgi:hypothetical protein